MNPTGGFKFDPDTLARFQKAKSAGVPDEINLQRAVQYQSTKSQQVQTLQQPKPGGLADLLPLIGAVGGSFLPIPGGPLLGPLIGGAIGAGGGTLAKQAVKREPFDTGEAFNEAKSAGIGGLIGGGIFKAGSKLLPGVAKLLGKGGEKLAVKAFRINPSQATNFADETGEAFGEFLARRNISSPGQLTSQATKLQQGFDDIAKSKNLVVDPNRVLNNFEATINKLKQSIDPLQKQKAQTLENIATNFVDQYGQGPIPANALTALRKEFDRSIKEFNLTPELKGPLNHARDVLEMSLRQSADEAGLSVGGKTFQEAGVELSKMYKAIEIAERQGNLGVGSLPFGITKLLGGAIGGGLGGFPGAAAGVAATSLINEPAALSIGARIAKTGGDLLSKVPSLPEAAGPTLVRAGAGVGVGPGEAQAEQGQILSQEPTIPRPSSFGSLTESFGQGNPQDALRLAIAEIMFSKAKSVGDIKTAAEFLLTSKDIGPKIDAITRRAALQAKQSLNQVDQLESLYRQAQSEGLTGSGPNLGRLQGIKGKAAAFTQTSSAAATYEASKKAFLSNLARASGERGVLTDEDIKRIKEAIPDFFDSPDVVDQKLETLRGILSGALIGTEETEQNTLFNNLFNQ